MGICPESFPLSHSLTLSLMILRFLAGAECISHCVGFVNCFDQHTVDGKASVPILGRVLRGSAMFLLTPLGPLLRERASGSVPVPGQ